MVRRIAPSQLRNELRRLESDRRRQIQRLDQEIRRHNDGVRRRSQEIRSAVNRLNQQARAHDVRVRANRQRVLSELARFQAQLSRPRYVALTTSTTILHRAYVSLESSVENRDLSSHEALLLDLSEQEDANSLAVTNDLIEGRRDSVADFQSELGRDLELISPELDDRWRGALFSLSPQNPDAARHFCSSAREIFTRMLDIGAPDSDVVGRFPECARVQDRRATRRSKISYCLEVVQTPNEQMVEFVDRDIDNIIELFNVLNRGTHGPAGTFDFPSLAGIKRRVEDGIRFLSKLIRR